MQNNLFKDNTRSKIFIWGPVILIMLLIFYFSSLPQRDIPLVFSYQDIFFHLAVYAALGFFLNRALRANSPNLSRVKLIILTAFLGLLYGVSDEMHQMLVPGRCASFFDLFLDGTGSFLGGALFKWPK